MLTNVILPKIGYYNCSLEESGQNSQIKGQIRVTQKEAKHGENIHKRKNDRWEECYIKV